MKVDTSHLMNTCYTSKESKLTDYNFILKWLEIADFEVQHHQIFDIFGEKLNCREVFETFRGFRSSRLRMTLALIKINKIPRLFSDLKIHVR